MSKIIVFNFKGMKIRKLYTFYIFLNFYFIFKKTLTFQTSLKNKHFRHNFFKKYTNAKIKNIANQDNNNNFKYQMDKNK